MNFGGAKQCAAFFGILFGRNFARCIVPIRLTWNARRLTSFRVWGEDLNECCNVFAGLLQCGFLKLAGCLFCNLFYGFQGIVLLSGF